MWWCCFLILQTRNFANICNSSLIWTYSGMTELPIYTVAATFTWCRPKRALSTNLLKHQMIENLWVCMHLVQLQIYKLSTTTNCVCVCVLKKVLTLNCALESSNLSILFECVRAFHQITTKLMFKKTISMELCESTLPMEYFTNLPFVICYLTWGQT